MIFIPTLLAGMTWFGIQQGACVRTTVSPYEVMAFLRHHQVRASVREDAGSVVIQFPTADDDGMNELDWYKTADACQTALKSG